LNQSAVMTAGRCQKGIEKMGCLQGRCDDSLQEERWGCGEQPGGGFGVEYVHEKLRFL
jgi:hypothetical protein